MTPEIEIQTASLSMPKAGSLGMIIDSDFVKELILKGVKIRIKTSSSTDIRELLESYQPETTNMLRFILSTAGKGLKPGRRLAEVSSMTIDSDALEQPLEILKVTVFGPRRNILHRERLFDGKVESWVQALHKLRMLQGQLL